MTEPLWTIFIALALALIVLTLWSLRSRQHDGAEGEADITPEDEALDVPADPADPRRKFSSPHDFQ
jgi:cbb3-type cytochrome oxidase maturation protein